jgi:tetratricopeptide (TPR) repeat protein
MAMRPITEVVQQAEMALEQERQLEAVRLCQALVTRFPKYFRAYLLLGQSALRLGDLLLAEEALQAARRYHPGSSEALLGLADIAEQRGHHELALRYCQAAWEHTPWQSSLRQRLVRLSAARFGEGQLFFTLPALASMYIHQGRWMRAALALESALRDLNDRPDLEQVLALVLWRAGRLRDASQWAHRVLERLPDAVVPLAVVIVTDSDDASVIAPRLYDVDLDGQVMAQVLTEFGAVDAYQKLKYPEPPMIDEDALVAAQREPAPLPSAESTVSLEQELALLDQLFRLPSLDELSTPPSQPAAPGEPVAHSHDQAPPPEPLLSLPSDEELEAARPSDVPASPELVALGSLPDIAPFSPEELGLAETAARPPDSESVHHPSAQAEPNAAGDHVAETLAHLGVTDDVVERARAAKQQLRETGILSSLPPEPPSEPPLQLKQEATGEPATGVPSAEGASAEPAPTTPATPVSAQSRSTEVHAPVPPDDSPEALFAAAQARLEAGRLDEALHFFHRVFRLGPAYDQQLIAALNKIAEETEGREAAAADRLLGAIYRRQGADALARRHYERSLRHR